MPARVVLSGMILVVFAAFLVFTVEFFIPLSAKMDMNMYCRNLILKMEMEGGLSDQASQDLHERLMGKGFRNIYIDGTKSAKQGEQITLRVEAEYIYSKMTTLFTRTDAVRRMVYEKASISRKVIN